jgi:PAS domain S-box-containing protein
MIQQAPPAPSITPCSMARAGSNPMIPWHLSWAAPGGTRAAESRGSPRKGSVAGPQGPREDKAGPMDTLQQRLLTLRRTETRRGLRALFLVLPPTLFVLGLVHLVTLGPPMAVLNAAAVWVLAVAILILRFSLLELEASLRWVMPTAVFTVVMLVGAVAVILHTVGQPVHVTYLVIVILGSGFFIISWWVLVVVLFAGLVGFGSAVVVHGPSIEWLQAAIPATLAAFLAGVFLTIRHRSMHWLLEVRRRDEQQKTSMGRSFQLAREMEIRSRTLAEAAFEGIIVHREQKVLDLNEAACRIVGLPRSRALGRDLRDFLDAEHHETYDREIDGRPAEDRETEASKWRLHDGRVIEVEARSRQIPYSGGKAEVLVVRDVTQERQAQREREAIRARLEGILESAGEGVYGLDREGRVVFANRAASELCGMPSGSMIGKDAHATIHHSRPDGSPYPESDCPIMAAVREGRLQQVEDEVFWRPDGSSFPVSYVASPLMDRGEVEGAVVVFQDNTHRVEIDRMKDELISVVGHELKTPLASIHGALRLIEGTKKADLQPETLKLISIAARNTERLSRLVNDLLDVERMRAGRLELEPTLQSSRDVVHEAVQGITSFAQAHKVTLEEEGENLEFVVDRDRMVQALTNLLSNAVKFSPPGGRVVVSVREEGDRVRLEVQDKGPGIAKEKMGLLFQRFSQLDSSDSRAKGGSGLGLVITRSIVEAHKGEVGVDSTPGEGSTFFILIPRDQAGKLPGASGGQR